MRVPRVHELSDTPCCMYNPGVMKSNFSFRLKLAPKVRSWSCLIPKARIEAEGLSGWMAVPGNDPLEFCAG